MNDSFGVGLRALKPEGQDARSATLLNLLVMPAVCKLTAKWM